jgi:membrane fusion protein (multidrug efflux system)
MLRRPRRAASLVVLALALASCGRGGAGRAGGRAGFQMPPMPVEVSPVETRAVRDQFRALGGIEASEIIEVTSEMAGVVRELPFGEGLPAAKGALLARLDDLEAGADAARAEAQRELAQSNARRAAALAEQQLISQQSLDDVRTALKIAEANESQVKARLGKTRIRAPWSGLVGRRRVSVGAYVRAGDPITEMARVDEVRVAFAAPERYMGELRPGIPVDVSTPAFPGRSFTGRLAVVDPNVDSETRTVQLVARVPNPGHLLKSGMSANVAVTFSERPGALVVPDEAVFAEGSQSFVFVVRADSTVTRTAIQLGLRDSSRVEVLHGLEPGQQVVRAGHQKLFEGARVMPITEAGAAAPGAPRGAKAAGSGAAGK